MTKNPVIDEVSKWSDLPGLIDRYTNSLGADGVGRIFGYASVIDNHKDIKPESETPNEENVSVEGMQVAMNVYAVGPAEFRGTTDLGSDTYNVGLYAGLEASAEEGAQAFGINVTLTPEQTAAGLTEFIRRELGNPPNGLKIEDLFDPAKRSDFESLEENFGLYKFQIIETQVNGEKLPAVAVSTNEKSEFSAIGISPHQAAYHILDGMGYSRPSGNGETMLGGEALDYFLNNVVKAYEERGYEQPKIEATRDAVVELAEAFQKIHKVQSLEHLSDKDKIERVEKVRQSEFVEKGIDITTPLFLNGEQVAERGEIADEFKAKSNLPKTASEKLDRFTDIVDSGRLEPLQR